MVAIVRFSEPVPTPTIDRAGCDRGPGGFIHRSQLHRSSHTTYNGCRVHTGWLGHDPDASSTHRQGTFWVTAPNVRTLCAVTQNAGLATSDGEGGTRGSTTPKDLLATSGRLLVAADRGAGLVRQGHVDVDSLLVWRSDVGSFVALRCLARHHSPSMMASSPAHFFHSARAATQPKAEHFVAGG